MVSASDPPNRLARVAGVGALLLGAALAAFVLLNGGSGHTYHLLFENGGQLVAGNEVLVAGNKIGTVDEVALTDDAQAEVTITLDRPLHDGTTAVIRATSLSGIANRYVSIAPGPDNAPTLPDGATLDGERTTSPVDLDQLFNTFRPKARRGLSEVIQGFDTIYAGAGPQANRAYKYFAPALGSTRRLFDEITADQAIFARFLVSSGRVLAAVAERRDDLSALTQNANEALGAIARENNALDRSLVALPPTLRQTNTTFVNLRAALGDLSGLVRTAKPATKDLAPFLADVRPVAERAVPVVADLSAIVRRTGASNDLTDLLRDLPRAESAAASARPRVLQALDDSLPVVLLTRPYSPDLLAWFGKFGDTSAYYDADGHYFRIQPTGANLFHYNGGTQQLEPIPPSQQFDDYTTLGLGPFARCPGGATQPIAGSNPFTDDGNLLAGGQPPNPKCDISAVPPGP